MDVEDHPHETQLVRVLIWPRWSLGWLTVSGIFAAVLAAAAIENAWIVCIVLALITAALVVGGLSETARACARALRALEGQSRMRAVPEPPSEPQQDRPALSSEDGRSELRPAELVQGRSQR